MARERGGERSAGGAGGRFATTRWSMVLAALELPGLPFVTLGSVLVLVYLSRRPVARIFELGRGEATLPTAEAGALERFIHGPPWT